MNFALSLPVTGNLPLFGAKVIPLHRPQASQTARLSGDAVNIRFGNAPALAAPAQGLLAPSLPLSQFETLVTEVGNSTQKRADKISALTEVIDEYLQGNWTDQTQPGKKAVVIGELKKLMGPRGQGNTIMAQINPTIGDLEGNAKKIMAYIDIAEQIGVDTIAFPELSLMGYPVHDVIMRHPFLVDENVKWLNAIAARCKKTKALVGFVEPRKPKPGKQATGKEFFNSMAVLADGDIQGLVRKSLLPNYGEFNDYRTFEFSPQTGMFPKESLGSADWGYETPRSVFKAFIKARKAQHGKPLEAFGKKYGLSICEDTWNDKDFMKRPLYNIDPIKNTAADKPDAIINISASPTRSRKEQMKHAMLSFIAKKYKVPYVYVNQVGAMDDVSFDGTSRVYDKNGKLVARAKAFKEQFMFANGITGEGKVYDLPKGLESTIGAEKIYDPYDQSDLGRTYDSIVQSIRDYFKKTGHEKAVIGLSGGLDSAVCAVLLVDALGKENVIGVGMPYGPISPEDSKTDAKELADNLGMQFILHPITAEVDTAWQSMSQTFGQVDSNNPDWKRAGTAERAATTLQNLQARTRATVLWSLSNEFKKAMPIATSDKSELYLGYATINGDMSGGFAPIGDILKTKTRLLAKWMNENRLEKNAIPTGTVTKPSGADLEIDPATGKPRTAEDDNMPYEFEDEIIFRIHNYGQSFQQMLEEPFWLEKRFIEKGTPLSRETKELWLKKFFWKMSSAFYKWNIFPTSPLNEGDGTINKKEYHQPVTCRVNWFGTRPGDIDKVLNPIAKVPPQAAV